MDKPTRNALTSEQARPSMMGLRQAWTWRPLASLTPATVADILRRASTGDARDFLLAAGDIEEKDLHYRAVLQTRRLAVAGLPWSVQAYDQSAAARKAADLVESVLAALDLPGCILDLMDALSKGYSVAELMWDVQGKEWRPVDILSREPHWFVWDQDTGRELRLLTEAEPVLGERLAPYKWLPHQPRVGAGIPLLGGLARSALWAWVFKSYALRDWAAFCEMYGQPIRVGKYHAGASPDDIAVLRRAVFDVGSDAAAVLPAEMVIDFIEAGGKSATGELYHTLIEYLDRQVSKAVLGQTMTTDQGTSGSLAQARVHDQVRGDLLRADVRALMGTINKHLVAPIVRLNLGENVPLPSFTLVAEDIENLESLAGQLETLVGMGAPVPVWWVRERWGIPEVGPTDEVLVAAQPIPGQILHSNPPCAGATHSGSDKHTAAVPEAPSFTPAELVADRLQQDNHPGMADWIERIEAMLESAGSLDEFKAMLLAAQQTLPDEALGKSLAQALAAAEAAGRFDLENEADG